MNGNLTFKLMQSVKVLIVSFKFVWHLFINLLHIHFYNKYVTNSIYIVYKILLKYSAQSR
jgi:hypothetical protein